MNQKTYSLKQAQIDRKWYIFSASDAPLGRVATLAAQYLLGKTKAQYSHHIDCGDFVIIINSDKLVVTGDKMDKKIYYRYSGYPSGLKSATLSEVIAKDSTKAVIQAVRGMLPDNKLRDGRLKRLKVYTGAEHPHDPQKPITLKVGN